MARIIFLCYHNGESRGLIDAIALLRKSGHTIKIMLLGVAACEYFETKSDFANLIYRPPNLGKTFGANSNFTQPLPEKDKQILKNWLATEKPDILVTGVPAIAQLEVVSIANDFALKPKIYVFFDCFIADFGKLVKFLPYTTNVLVPTTMVYKKLQQHLNFKHSINVAVVGHCEIDSWICKAKRLNKEQIKKKMHVATAIPIILWAGGYGLEEQIALHKFTNIIKKQQLINDITFVFKLTMHPGIAFNLDEIEENYINPLLKAGFSMTEISDIIISPNIVNTLEAATVAVAMVSLSSTSCITAAFIGTQVAYFNSENNRSILDIPGIERYNHTNSISSWFKKCFNKHKASVDESKLSQNYGLKLNAAENIFKALTN